MKALLFAVTGLLALCAPAMASSCHLKAVNINTEWKTMTEQCLKSMQDQIKMEVRASLQYLGMASHFSRDFVNRPGFAKLFFDAAGEEREHAMKLIEYLLMRGELVDKVTNLIDVRSTVRELTNELRKEWLNGTEALEHALVMESTVTKSIRQVIQNCENEPHFNDYHLVDYLSGDFLDEQYRGHRDLAGKATTLKKMYDSHAALGEFIFDKKLLGMDIYAAKVSSC
uniref:Ferritin n=1 Tax=Lonomia obliqua TaxID=304329 RepID=Q5MGP3_LONON|nr:ferritin 1 [Lonomia obliqua]